jgi:hypothetical protein
LTLDSRITDQVKRIVDSPAFKSWLSLQKKREAGGLILINNSFVFHDVKTHKASDFVALRLNRKREVSLRPLIASGSKQVGDFKYFSPRGPQLPTRNLHAAVTEEIKQLGEVLFVLIGGIGKTTPLTKPIEHKDFDDIVWDPAKGQSVAVNGRRIEVGQVADEQSIWVGIEAYYNNAHLSTPKGLQEAVSSTVDQLQEDAVADLPIPEVGETPGHGITDQIVKALNEQLIEYDVALNVLLTGAADVGTSNELLRLAYNFTSDAISYLRLIVSVCDLKPIVFWGTLSSHFALSEAFRQLPWTRSRTKVSMNNYIGTISDARNRAFHNAFPFRTSLNIPLSGVALSGATITIFSEHRLKERNTLSYPDKPLVDLLLGFTRARERHLTTDYWQRNRQVMKATIALFEDTSGFIKQLQLGRPKRSRKSAASQP